MTSYARDWKASDMTLRDYFAAQALGMFNNILLAEGAKTLSGAASTRKESHEIFVATACYEIADAMLTVRRAKSG